MKYVYLIQSIPHQNEKYIGITSDLKDRLKVHNEGGAPHTSKRVPDGLLPIATTGLKCMVFSIPQKALLPPLI